MKQLRSISWALAALVLGGMLGTAAQAQDNEQTERIRAALASPERSAENKARDEARRPIQVIRFLGIETGMTVLDVVAAGGWYTEVLSAAVGPSGKVLSHNPEFFAQREGFVEAAQMRADELGNVELVIGDIADAGIDGQADAAISALNLHDMYNSGGEQAALSLLEGVYTALKPGGVFGLIDHVGVEGEDNAELHRMLPSDARRLLIDAGFEVESVSDLLENPDDDHTLGVRDPSVGTRTGSCSARASRTEGAANARRLRHHRRAAPRDGAAACVERHPLAVPAAGRLDHRGGGGLRAPACRRRRPAAAAGVRARVKYPCASTPRRHSSVGRAGVL